MLVWPLLQGRRIDGAPTLRIPLCAGECPSPLTSANTRLTEPRETGVHDPSLSRDDVNSTQGATRSLDRASRFIQGNINAHWLRPARTSAVSKPHRSRGE